MPEASAPRTRLRRFPYPYRGALALSNDAEFLSPRAFWDLHRFLNTREQTPLGEGLDLQITDCAFMYSVEPGRSFSYFEGTGSTRSRHAGWMAELMQIGCIDVLHTYGDFDGVGGCTRELAARALEELHDRGVKLQVWTNHGTADNTQNLGASHAYYQRGDLPGSSEYHADLLLAYGVRFAWMDFNATNVFGQDGRPPRRRLLRAALSRRGLAQARREHAENVLLQPERLQDGSTIHAFTRYRGPDRPDPGTLAAQLSYDHLRGLVDAEAVAIVYQHLGCDRRTGSCLQNAPPYLDGEALGALRALSEAHHEGRILVTGVERLLRYELAHRGLRWRERREGGRLILEIERVDVPEAGSFVPAAADLEGITFVVPAGLDAAVTLGGGDLAVERVHERRSTLLRVPLTRFELPPTPREVEG